jgi:hypothetical protein
LDNLKLNLDGGVPGTEPTWNGWTLHNLQSSSGIVNKIADLKEFAAWQAASKVQWPMSHVR